jgi:hypothetical protein
MRNMPNLKVCQQIPNPNGNNAQPAGLLLALTASP